jgi:hypothetical protein
MIDLVKEFVKYEKKLSEYIDNRIGHYKDSECYKLLDQRIKILNASWDMRSGDLDNLGKFNFKANISYGLVKQEQLAKRAIFSNNFRNEPLFTPKAIGNTPDENAINMRDLIMSNNQQTHFRHKVLMPGNGGVAKIGVQIVFTEYCNDKTMAWRTVADPVLGSKRMYGPVKDTHNAASYLVSDPRNYVQDPCVTESDESPYRGHYEPWSLASLVNRIRQNPDLYIRENVEQVIRKYVKDGYKSEYYFEGKTGDDYGKTILNDVFRGQFQFHIDGNEEDSTYYYIEKIGDLIIRFQDNPYDMNMNHYTVLTCERRDEYFWGNCSAEYKLTNENNLNLLLSLDLDNAIESMRKYVMFNKGAITMEAFRRASHDGIIGVDNVPTDIPIQNLFYTYQIPDNSGQTVGNTYARMMQNNQEFSSSPDINRPKAMGGPENKTLGAAQLATESGNIKDADILERLSFCWALVGDKISVIMQQFLGNFGPILVRPGMVESMRWLEKYQFTGNYCFEMDTALQQNYMGEILRYQNIVTWLQNLINGGAQLPRNIYPFVEQTLKMGKFLKVDEYLDQSQQQITAPGMVPTAPQPGMETAGAAQEINPQGVAA